MAIGSDIQSSEYTDVPCDICGSTSTRPVPFAPPTICICNKCGFVYVTKRRSAAAITAEWSNELFFEAYTANLPAIQARLAFAAAFLHSIVPLTYRTLLDIGAGTGDLLRIVKRWPYKAVGTGLDPSDDNCKRIVASGCDALCYAVENAPTIGMFDVTTLTWTLENCRDPARALRFAREHTRPGGHILVATGSRILVPFKKPLDRYFSNTKPDTHPSRFSANSLGNILLKAGFDPMKFNDYESQDWLACVAVKSGEVNSGMRYDDPDKVEDYFRRWNTETERLKRSKT